MGASGLRLSSMIQTTAKFSSHVARRQLRIMTPAQGHRRCQRRTRKCKVGLVHELIGRRLKSPSPTNRFVPPACCCCPLPLTSSTCQFDKPFGTIRIIDRPELHRFAASGRSTDRVAIAEFAPRVCLLHRNLRPPDRCSNNTKSADSSPRAAKVSERRTAAH